MGSDKHVVNVESIDRLDHAYELLLVLWSIIFGTFFQFLTWLCSKSELTAIVFNALPILTSSLLVVIFAWLWKMIVENENLKMFLRIFAWISCMAFSVWYIEIMILPCFFGLGVRDKTLAAATVMLGLASVMAIGAAVCYKVIFIYMKAAPNLEIWRSNKKFAIMLVATILLIGLWIGSVGDYLNGLIRGIFPAV